MASGTFKWYGKALQELAKGTHAWPTATYYVMLTTSSYSPTQGGDDYKDDVGEAVEVSGDGYTAGGKALSSRALSYVAASSIVKLTASDVSWPSSSITDARTAVIYRKVSDTASQCPLIAYATFDADVSSVAGTFTLDFPSNVVLRLTAS